MLDNKQRGVPPTGVKQNSDNDNDDEYLSYTQCEKSFTDGSELLVIVFHNEIDVRDINVSVVILSTCMSFRYGKCV